MDMVSIWCVTIKCLYVYANLLIFVYLLGLYDFDTSLEMPDHVVVFCFFCCGRSINCIAVRLHTEHVTHTNRGAGMLALKCWLLKFKECHHAAMR